LHEGLTFREVGIPYHERSGRSKLSVIRDGLRFLGTILWTALQYNPGRLLEAAGVACVTLAIAIWTVLALARLSGLTQLDAAGVFVVYASLVLAVGGVSTACLGTAFNRLVALFHRAPIRQKGFVSDLFGAAAERRFGWLGASFVGVGVALAAASLVLSLGGWEITRLWFWLLGSALVFLVGLHLVLFWGLLQVLSTLEARPGRIGLEMATSSTLPGTLESIEVA
jgi:hypothetical protein